MEQIPLWTTGIGPRRRTRPSGRAGGVELAVQQSYPLPQSVQPVAARRCRPAVTVVGDHDQQAAGVVRMVISDPTGRGVPDHIRQGLLDHPVRRPAGRLVDRHRDVAA